MSRRRNLLEAFKSADRVATPTSAAAPVRSQAPPPVPPFSFARPTSGGSVPTPRWLFPLVGLTLAFLLGFLLGRRSGPLAPNQARAHEAELGPRSSPERPAVQPRAFQEKPEAGSAQGPGAKSRDLAATGTKRIEDSALFDTRNQWTLAVVSYSKAHKDHLDFAWATHQALVDAGLPVFPPVASGNLVLVLAGAAPTAAELDRIETSVHNLVREGKKPYADAYAARIDSLIPDRTPKGN